MTPPPEAGIGIIDLLMAIPRGDTHSPVEYLFKDAPHEVRATRGADLVLREMDRFGVERGLIGVAFDDEPARDALRDHPDRFIGCFTVDPNRGTDGVRDLTRACEELGVRAASAFPCGYSPPVPINDRRMFPLYAACVDLDLPIFVNAGVPGPRVPAAPQDVMLIDEVCWEFPDLTFVTRHGCEPWADLAVKLMLKWPNLHYSTSAFAPRYYPEAVVDFANTRGADQVLYAGYFPMGLSLERIMTELPDVPFRDHVWPKFLRENALRVLRL